MSVLGTQVYANENTPIWLSASTIVPTGPTGPTGVPGSATNTGATGPTGPMNPLTQYGTVATTGANGNTTVTLGTTYTSATSYVALGVMEDTNPAQVSTNRISANSFTIYWANAGSGNHTIAWATFGS